MKKGKMTLFLLIIMFFIISSEWVLAEERSIFVGDLLEIRVSSQKLSMDELRDNFKDFEIVNIKDDAGSYLITLRSFETGEKVVQLGDKEIIIDIKSTLDEIKRDDIFEGDLSPEEAGFSINLQYVFYVLLIIFLSTGGINLWRYLKKRKISSLSPHQYFINQTNAISWADREYFVKLTLSFKEYLESRFSCRIRGKTSSEIINEISCLPDLQESLPDIRFWLEECDRFKFAGIIVSKEKKQKFLGELAELVSKIEGI